MIEGHLEHGREGDGQEHARYAQSAPPIITTMMDTNAFSSTREATTLGTMKLLSTNCTAL